MNMTPDNYHSLDANQAYVSHSQIKTWQECPARWHAEYIAGSYKRDPSDAMLVGSYVDVALTTPDAFRAWRESQPGILKKNGEPYAKFETANRMIAAVNSSQMRSMLIGDGQEVYTATISGVPVRCMVDVANRDHRRIVDLKTTADIHKEVWVKDQRRYGNFIDAWNYWQQMALYRHIVAASWGFVPDVFIAAVDQRDPCGLGMYHLNGSADGEYRLRSAEVEMLETLFKMQPYRVSGEAPGDDHHCGACDYCRGIVSPVMQVWDDMAGVWVTEGGAL